MKCGQLYHSKVTGIHYLIMEDGYKYWCAWGNEWKLSANSKWQLINAGFTLKLIGNNFRLK